MGAAAPRRRQAPGRAGRALAGALVAAAVGACAGGAPAAPGGAAAGGPAAQDGTPTFRITDPLEREVNPFEVVDARGTAYAFPFLGGFDVPRPQLVDIDGDGDLDLFLQKYRGELMFFENTGTPTAPRFTWRTSNWMGLDVGEWARFHDMDGDGDLDLFMELPSSYVRYAENVGTPREPRFEITADSVRLRDGRALFADAQNIPFLVDVNCNGRTDLFLGRIDGTVSRYEAVGFDQGSPVFELVAERFENIEIVAAFGIPGGPLPPGLDPLGGGERPGEGERPTLHGANSMAFADIDGDGAPDLLWGDFFEPGLLLIENVGSCAQPNLDVEPVPVPAEPRIATSGYNAPALGDLDGDGHLDLLVGVLGGAYNANRTSVDNLLHYRGTPEGVFELVTPRFIHGLDLGSESVPALGDLDGDGDLDLLVGSKLDPETSAAPPLHWYENTGTPREPRFVYRGALDEVAHMNGAPILVDFRGDGNPDLLLGTFNQQVRHYRNEGTPERPRFVESSDEPLVRLPRGSYSAPAAGDLSGNGLLDLVVGESSGEINYFRNVGTREVPRFELVTEQLGGIDVGSRSSPFLVDADGDGLLDLLVGEESGRLYFFRNVGTRTEPAFEAEGVLLEGRFPRLAAPRLADLDGDGDLDLVLGDQGGGLVFFRNRR
jgi:hypothetical protein